MKKKFFISLIIAGLCLWLAVRNISWTEVKEALKNVNLSLLSLIFVLNFLSHYFRARRWRVLMKPIREISMKELFAINAVGFLAITALPLRLGEMTRPLLLKRRHNVPLSTGIAAVTVERVFDGLVAIMALAIGLLAAPIGFGEMPGLGMGLKAMTLLMLAIYLPILAFLILAVVKREIALRLIRHFIRWLPSHLHMRLEGIASNFFEGLKSLPDIRSFLWIWVESLGVWGAVLFSYWICLRAFDLHLPWSAPFTVLGVSAVGVMLPAAPGFVGTFQLFVVSSLALYGVGKSMGLAYSIVIHALNLIYIMFAGLAFVPGMSQRFGAIMSESIAAKPDTRAT